MCVIKRPGASGRASLVGGGGGGAVGGVGGSWSLLDYSKLLNSIQSAAQWSFTRLALTNCSQDMRAATIKCPGSHH